MKFLLAAAALFVSLSAHATVGVALGHHTWADDGMPEIGPGEQARVFVCRQHDTTRIVALCALEKCAKAFGFDLKAPVVLKNGRKLLGGKCNVDGRTDDRGYSVIVVGPPGDNQFIVGKALGAKTREIAIEYIKKSGFPMEKATVVYDEYDPDGL